MMAKTQPDPNMDVYQAYPKGYRGIFELKVIPRQIMLMSSLSEMGQITK